MTNRHAKSIAPSSTMVPYKTNGPGRCVNSGTPGAIHRMTKEESDDD